MPTSAQENKDIAKKWIDKLPVKRVLDIGAGEGTYSDLLRKPYQEWIAVEAYYPYVQEFNLESKYNEIIISDIRYLDYSKLPKLDLSIAGDMLEHMIKKEAKEVIENLLVFSKYVLLCFPVLHLHQHIPENPFEEHIDHWTYEDMRDYLEGYGVEIIESIAGDILAYFLLRGRQ